MAPQAGRHFWFALKNGSLAWRNLLGVSLAALGCVGAKLGGAEGLATVFAGAGDLTAGRCLLGAGVKARKLPIIPFRGHTA
jgi:hypothetical protein